MSHGAGYDGTKDWTFVFLSSVKFLILQFRVASLQAYECVSVTFLSDLADAMSSRRERVRA